MQYPDKILSKYIEKKFSSDNDAILCCGEGFVEYMTNSHSLLKRSKFEPSHLSVKLSNTDPSDIVPVQICSSQNHILLLAYVKNRARNELFVITSKKVLKGMGFYNEDLEDLDKPTLQDSMTDIEHLVFKDQPEIDRIRVKDIEMISTGNDFSLILDQGGEVWSWGEASAALGCSNTFRTHKIDSEYTPYKIYFKHEKGKASRICYIECGSNFSSAIDTEGRLYVFGNNNFGQCAKDPKYITSQSIPRVLALSVRVKKVACGLYHAICLCEQFSIYSWGSNSHGQLGYSTPDEFSYTPQEIIKLKSSCCSVIAAGDNNSMAFSDAGQAFGWGNNAYFKLGVIDSMNAKVSELETGVNYTEPQQFNFDLEVKKPGPQPAPVLYADEYIIAVKLLTNFSVGLTNNKRLMTWGLDIKRQGQLDKIIAVGKDGEALYLQFYMKPLSTMTVNCKYIEEDDYSKTSTQQQVFCGENFSMVLTESRELIVWGSNKDFQHGTSEKEIRQFYMKFMQSNKISRKNYMVAIESLPHFIENSKFRLRQVTSVALGYRHVVIIEKKRIAYAWGCNRSKQLGVGRDEDYVKEPESMKKVSGLDLEECVASKDYTLLRTKQGNVYACGSNEHGKLGIPEKSPQIFVDIPEQIKLLEGVIKLAAGPEHAMALCSKKISGHDNDVFTRLTVEEETSKDSKISELKTIYSWGNGLLGQLGRKKIEDSLFPQKIETPEKFKEIACGHLISAAITEDDKLFLWGAKENLPNFYQTKNIGQIDKIIDRPTQFVKDDLKFRSISLGYNYHCVIGTNGRLYSWGFFDRNKDKVAKSMIFSEVKGSNISQKCHKVAVGPRHALYSFAKNVFSWGLDNYTGRLGQMIDIHDARQSKKRQKNKNSENLKKYDPNLLQGEPCLVEPIKFLINVQSARGQLTKKSDSNKSMINETTNTQLSGQSRESVQQDSFKLLKDRYMFHLYENAERTFMRLNIEVRKLFELHKKRQNLFERMRYLLYKRVTEQPFDTNLRMDASETEPELRTAAQQNLYNTLLTGIQLHPCLLVGVLKKNLELGDSSVEITPYEFLDITSSIFGSVHGNERKEDLFLTLLELVFKWEVGTNCDSEEIDFFEFDDLRINKLSTENIPKGKKLPYSNLLIDHILQNDISFRMILEQIYDHIEMKITEKMKAVDKNLKKFVYAYRLEGSSQLEKLYATDTSNWKEEEFQKRADNLKNLFKDHDKNPIMHKLCSNFSRFIIKFLNKMKQIFSDNFKDFKGNDLALKLFWGFLIKPLFTVSRVRIFDKQAVNERESERLQENIKSILHFFMYLATGTKIQESREGSKWIKNLNRFINKQMNFFRNKMASTLSLQNRQDEEDGTQMRPKIVRFRNYMRQAKEATQEKINLKLSLLVKICKTVNHLRHENDLFSEFINQVGEKSFLETGPDQYGEDKSFNFTLINNLVVLFDFVSIRQCAICESFCPSTYMNPNSVKKVIEKIEGIGTNRDLEVYIRYLGILKFEKAKEEINGRSKGEDYFYNYNYDQLVLTTIRKLRYKDQTRN